MEVRLLQSRGYQLIPKNEVRAIAAIPEWLLISRIRQCGEHELDPRHTTLVYMPHCPGKLYDAFVRQNWDERLLGTGATGCGDSKESSAATAGLRAVLLANDFRGYIDK